MLTGKEEFEYENQKIGLNILNYWQWHYSDIFALHDTIAEFIVAKALECKGPINTGSWTLYDIAYRNKRIEVKETSYYHSWQTDEEPKSKVRTFGLTQAYKYLLLVPCRYLYFLLEYWRDKGRVKSFKIRTLGVLCHTYFYNK